MVWTHEKFASAVNVEGGNRHVKIVYLVPFDNSRRTSAILDAVFDESYSRWGGVSTLIIPIVFYDFLFEQFEKWIEVYDPDYIISFVHINQKLINKIESLTNAIYIKKETIIEDRLSMRNCYRLNIEHADSYVSSVSTVSSPYLIRRKFGQKNISAIPVILTHYPKDRKNYFVSNNFGISLKYMSVTYPVNGLYDTLCFTDGPPPPRHATGGMEAETVNDVMMALTNDFVIPISRLSAIEGRLNYRVKNRKISDNFNIFIGKTALDRINFWNSRHFSIDHFNNSQSLIVNKTLCDNDDFLQCLGKYLNEFNYSGAGGQSRVCLWSQKYSSDDLSNIVSRLREHTFNEVKVHPNSNGFILPEDSGFELYSSINDQISYKLFEEENVIVPEDPIHFKYFPYRFRGLLSGAWIYEFDIERHENLSIYSNVVDSWCPARKPGVNLVFSKNTGRVTRYNRLAVIPTTDDNLVIGDSSRSKYKIFINLPTDNIYFSSVVCQRPSFFHDDIRMTLRDKYEFIEISDKGQNLRGIISMFDSLNSAFDCLCNIYWQNFICSSTSYFDMNKLRSLLPMDTSEKELIRQYFSFNNIKEVNKYLECSLLDSIENMISKKVILQFFNWRCNFCGNQNYVDVDSLKSINKCTICSNEYDLPIDFVWTFKVNDFVKNALRDNNGISVLWALGYLQNHYHHSIQDLTIDRKFSFYYMPEVDLYSKFNAKKNEHEVDLLCMVKGKLHVVEVKKNAFGFASKEREIEKFIKIVNKIEPDVALIMCEDYHDDKSKHIEVRKQLEDALFRIKENVKSGIEVKSIIRSEVRTHSDPHGCIRSLWRESFNP